MAKNNRMTFVQRQELHHILDWCRRPVKTPMQMMIQTAVRKWLDGEDAMQHLLDIGIPKYQVDLAIFKAQVFLNNERGKRRNFAKQILESRQKSTNEFTTENFRVNIDKEQDRNYGMTSMSIYCIVEVWEQDAEDEPERSYLTNFSDFKTKEWLTRLLVWGLSNKRELIIKPASPEEMTSMRMFVPRDSDREAERAS